MGMDLLERLMDAARAAPRRILLSEGQDPRIARAAVMAREAGIARVSLVGPTAEVAAAIRAAEGDPGGFEIRDPAADPARAGYADALHDHRAHKGMTEARALAAIGEPLAFAAMAVRQGDADGTIGGAVHTTADTVRAALQIIGRAEGARIVSSFFLMLLDPARFPERGVLVFSDAGLVVAPDDEELAQIALASAASHEALVGRLTGEPARVAFLSFSTAGSAAHARASAVRNAAARVRAARPDLAVDGEIQFDAAFAPEVAAAKLPDGQTGGRANVMVFPNLDAGNIGYKIAQRIGGARAIGPILQGLAHPANDLSRGCTAEDALAMIAVTVAQANAAAR